MNCLTSKPSLYQLAIVDFDLDTDLYQLTQENMALNIVSTFESGKDLSCNLVSDALDQQSQINISALDEEEHLDLDSGHVEWNVASVRDMQIAIVGEASNLISKSYARPDNLEDIFAWVFDTDSEDAFSISGCAMTLKLTTYDLQRRFYRRLKRTMNALGPSVKQPKRDFYARLAKKARTCLAKNANYVVCTEVEAQVADIESEFRPSNSSRQFE